MRYFHIVIVLLVTALVGLFVGRAWVNYSPALLHIFSGNAAVYQADNLNSEDVQPAQTIGWAALLPKNHAVVLDKFQSPSSLSFSDQVTRSIEAGSSQQYRSALYATDIVEEVLDKRVALPGFLVPLMLHEDRSVESFFIVPYFGACIHYPPPPPNQMVYVSLPKTAPLPDINEPYLFTGVLREGLYEDLLGTSAYIMDVDTIDAYHSNPDDVRNHDL